MQMKMFCYEYAPDASTTENYVVLAGDAYTAKAKLEKWLYKHFNKQDAETIFRNIHLSDSVTDVCHIIQSWD